MARKRDTQDETTSDDIAVDERTASVEEAAAARIEGPVGASGPLDEQAPGESVTGEALPGGVSWEQVNEGVGEELADPEDAEGLEGDPADDVDSAKESRHSDWSLGGGDGEGSSLSPPFGGSSQAGAEGGGGGTFGQNVYGQEIDPGAVPPLNPAADTAGTSPLTRFAEAADDKLGRNSGLSGGDDVDDAPTFGQGMIADADSSIFSDIVDSLSPLDEIEDAAGTAVDFLESVDWDNVAADVHEASKNVWNPPGGRADPYPYGSGGSWFRDPGPDGEGAPIPEDLQRQLDADMARLREMTPHRNPDDGAEDPVEGDPAFGAGAGTGTPTGVLAQGKGGLIGNPEGIEVGGGAPQGNPGADSQGAGVINTENDPTAKGPEDSPFDAAEPTIEPFEETGESETESDDGGAESFLSLGPTEIAGPVDEIPDDVVIGPV